LLTQSPYFSSTADLWRDYPHFAVPRLVKIYYLFTLSFWVEQLLSIQWEHRRKDYVELFVHHCVTIALITSSWYMHLWRIGHVIMAIMDIGDVPLAFAKMMRYAGQELLCNVSFGTFLLVWIYTRYYHYGRILYSGIVERPLYLTPEWDPEHGKYLSHGAIVFYGVLLILLMLLMVFWGVMIAKVVLKVLSNSKVDDVRSDSEDDAKSQ
jgi:acyl-CoA-dependent ceramide synthase